MLAIDAVKLDNAINDFLKISQIILYHVFFITYLFILVVSLLSKAL